MLQGPSLLPADRQVGESIAQGGRNEKGAEMNLHRSITWLGAATVALAVGLPVASAGPRLVDDYFRDAQRSVQQSQGVTNRIVDDYFRDAPRSINPSPGVTNRIVDDYFRDDAAPAVTSSNHGSDVSIGIAVAVGGMLLIFALGAGALAARRTRSRRTSPAATT